MIKNTKKLQYFFTNPPKKQNLFFSSSKEFAKEEWKNLLKATSHDILYGFTLASLSIFSATLFENSFIPLGLLCLAPVQLFQYKTRVLEIERNVTNNELIRLKKAGLFKKKEKIFNIKEIEYLYCLASDKIFLAIFLQNHVYTAYVFHMSDSKENQASIIELIGELQKYSKK